MESEKYTFKMQRLAQVVAIQSKGIMLEADRFKFEDHVNQAGQHLIRLVLDLATQEEELCKYPATWWEYFKLRWFPEWLKRKFPVEWTEVFAVHKYPELGVPDGLLGREFIHLRVISPEEVENYGKVS